MRTVNRESALRRAPSTPSAVSRRAWLASLALVFAAPLLACAGKQPAPRRRFGTASVRIVVESRMSSSFRLIGAKLSLDERPIYERRSEDLAGASELPVYDAQLEAGEHDLRVELDFRGVGYGVFAYLKGYRFRVKAQRRFEIDGGQRTVVRVTAHERGGPTTPLEERPAIAVSVAAE